MASCFHLLKQWDDVLVYLSSIRSYFPTDGDFNWNFGIASAAHEQWADAEEGLLAIRSEAYQQEHAYTMWLAKTCIMQGAQSAGSVRHAPDQTPVRESWTAWADFD